MTEPKRLNPEISSAEVGVRELKDITIYPLSMADQLSMTNLVTSTVRKFFEKEDTGDDLEFARFLSKLIEENLETILSMVTDDNAASLDDITNNQAVAIAELVYEVNFGSLVKKVKSLLEKVNEQFPSGRLSPMSFDGMEDTGSKTSTEEVSETEVSH